MIGVKKKEEIFFDLFIEAVENISLAGEAFEDLVKNYTNVDDKVTHLKELEIAGDNVSHRLLRELNESFITPFDREDIIAITKGLDSIVDVLDDFRQAGYTIVTTSSDQGKPLFSTALPAKMVLVLGRELESLPEAAREPGDLCVKIDGTGNVENLNVSVATGVLLGEWWRQNKA